MTEKVLLLKLDYEIKYKNVRETWVAFLVKLKKMSTKLPLTCNLYILIKARAAHVKQLSTKHFWYKVLKQQPQIDSQGSYLNSFQCKTIHPLNA